MPRPPDIFARLRPPLLAALQTLAKHNVIPPDYDSSAITLDSPRETAHGDIAINAALVLAKAANSAPRALAEKILPLLVHPAIKSAAIAGPGFINLTLRDEVFREEIGHILAAGEAYGAPDIGQGEKVNLEYVSANPTGPLHIGHARGAVFADVLANLLAHSGYAVTREYYVNDAGGQMEALEESLKLRIREAKGEAITIPPELYPGEYLTPLAQSLAARKTAYDLRAEALAAMLALIREDLAALGVRHDVFTRESAILAQGKIDKAIAQLKQAGLVYAGVPEKPKGEAENWTARKQDLFRASQFGDEQDRPLRRADGSWTYFAADIAYHADKYRRGFASMIDVWGADHAGYVKRLAGACSALTGGKARLAIKLCHLVRLLRDGKTVKMSKRDGSYVSLREAVEEAGAGAIRFMMLTRRNDAPLDFDFARVREQNRDNPVFYVQYAHARICSLLRQLPDAIAAQEKEGHKTGIDLAPLAHPAELALIRQLALYPRTLARAAENLEPHRIVYYLQDLAASFHSLWTLGRSEPSLRFLIPANPHATLARLQLIRSCRVVLAAALKLLGVAPVEEMR